jgi:hypothetical protein
MTVPNSKPADLKYVFTNGYLNLKPYEKIPDRP